MQEINQNSNQSDSGKTAERDNVSSLPARVFRGSGSASEPENQPRSQSQGNLSLPPRRLLGMQRYVVDGMFGRRHWARDWVLELCEADPGFLLHLADQSQGYVHFLCLARLALMKQSNEDENPAFASSLYTQSKKDILQGVFPSCPKCILGVLPKLPKKPMSGETYEKLIELLTDSEIQKMLLHKKHIRQNDLALLELCKNIPEEFRTGKVFGCITGYDEYAHLNIIIKTANRFNVKINKEEINGIMSNKEKLYAIEKFVLGKIKNQPFPEPPWPGNDRLRPVCSKSKLITVKNQFRNCIMQYLGKIMLGYNYFYVCKSPHAVIEVRKDPVLGWGIGEIEGPNNREISMAEKHQIIGAFSDSDFYPRPSIGFRMGDDYRSFLDEGHD